MTLYKGDTSTSLASVRVTIRVPLYLIYWLTGLSET
jgi:hypothetical protein